MAKKALSLLLSLLMIMSVFTCVDISAFAASVENFSAKWNEEGDIVEHTYGYYTSDYIGYDEETGESKYTEDYFVYYLYASYFVYSFEYDGVTYTDVSSGEFYDITGIDLWVEADQSYGNQWGIGKHEVIIYCYELK